MPGWKKARGTISPLAPLLGRWVAQGAKMPDGSAGDCSREFTAFGAGFVRLDAGWDMGPRGVYREVAFFGKSDDGALAFWSFTVDGKRSTGILSDASDVHRDVAGACAPARGVAVTGPGAQPAAVNAAGAQCPDFGSQGNQADKAGR